MIKLYADKYIRYKNGKIVKKSKLNKFHKIIFDEMEKSDLYEKTDGRYFEIETTFASVERKLNISYKVNVKKKTTKKKTTKKKTTKKKTTKKKTTKKKTTKKSTKKDNAKEFIEDSNTKEIIVENLIKDINKIENMIENENLDKIKQKIDSKIRICRKNIDKINNQNVKDEDIERYENNSVKIINECYALIRGHKDFVRQESKDNEFIDTEEEIREIKLSQRDYKKGKIWIRWVYKNDEVKVKTQDGIKTAIWDNKAKKYLLTL